MLNPATITTDEELAHLLLQLGFLTQPGDYYRTPIQKSTPSRCIMAQENDLFSHVAVAVGQQQFLIFFFNELNQWFSYYEQLAGEVSPAILRETILKASRWESITFTPSQERY
jgi:hypothetical protein